ncbi:MAG: rhomboid family intramembrane serine protease, partial [Candidatus Nanoarchaeia archaeon]
MGVFAFGIPMPMFLAAIVWMIGDIIRTFMPTNVGTIAHLSGLFLGLIVGLMIRKDYTKSKRKQLEVPNHILERWEDNFVKH